MITTTTTTTTKLLSSAQSELQNVPFLRTKRKRRRYNVTSHSPITQLWPTLINLTKSRNLLLLEVNFGFFCCILDCLDSNFAFCGLPVFFYYRICSNTSLWLIFADFDRVWRFDQKSHFVKFLRQFVFFFFFFIVFGFVVICW